MYLRLSIFHLALIGVAVAQQLSVLPAEESLRGVAGKPAWNALTPSTEFSYRLGANDILSVSVLELEEASSNNVRIRPDGSVRVPFAGRVQAAGLTLEEFELKLMKKFAAIVHQPHVVVNIVEMRSHEVSILGAVKSPGIYRIDGQTTLLQLLTLAGGPREDAGYRVRISRRAERGDLPLPQAKCDETGQFNVADIDLQDLTDGLDPAANVKLSPGDVVSVPRGKMVYVLGAVSRPGGFVLSEREDISILEVLALAGGTTQVAAKKRAKILRAAEGRAGRQEIDVNIKAIFKAKQADLFLESEDILLIPESGAKKTGAAASAAAIGALPTVALWRLIRGN